MTVEDRPYLRLWNDGGAEVKVPITETGGTIRVAVGVPGRRSEIWRIWANSNHGDVYVAARSMAGIQKYSLHESGDWRYAFTQQFYASASDADDDRPSASRILDQWQRRPGVDGQVVLSIRIRAEDVTEVDDSKLKRANEIIWLPAPTSGNAVFIGLVMMRDDLVLELKGTRPVDLLLLSSQEGVLVIWQSIELSATALADAKRYREQGIAAVPPELQKRKGEPGLRLGVFGFDNDSGERFVWDMAY